ncbi:hypothetical protein ACFVS2_20230 [Brevibacillus sp. NPDC058079]|uniref:hypothetical protein n=1 Tax=Brevibacillus sp. NPDC058079 TaxID=3346330 RepID=UPI0036E3181A
MINNYKTNYEDYKKQRKVQIVAQVVCIPIVFVGIYFISFLIWESVISSIAVCVATCVISELMFRTNKHTMVGSQALCHYFDEKNEVIQSIVKDDEFYKVETDKGLYKVIQDRRGIKRVCRIETEKEFERDPF